METTQSSASTDSAVPRVSVLVPVYRTDRGFLRAAIRSVLDQTFRDFELLLLDDCPDDPREEVVREFDDPRIRYERNPRNLGITPARNRLMELARGEYLAVFDHDDICRHDRLEKQVAYLDAHPECGVVSSWTREIPADKLRRYPEDDARIRLELMGGCMVAHTAAMLRASVLKANGIRYDESCSPAEDYRLWLELLGKTQFHNLPEPLLDYRLYANNTAKRQAAKMRLAAIHCQAYAQATYPELYAAYDRAAKRVTVVRFLGLPIWRTERLDNRSVGKLFGVLPIVSTKTSRNDVR